MSRQPRPGGHRHARDDARQARAVGVDQALRADAVAVLDQAQADGVGVLVPVPQQLGRLGGAAVGAQALHVQLLAEEAGGELEILAFRTQADADHGLHGVLRQSQRCANDGGAREDELDRRHGACIWACHGLKRAAGVVTRLLPIPQPMLLVGPGASARLGQAIADFGHHKVLLVTDAVVTQAGPDRAADRRARGQRHRVRGLRRRSRPTRRSRWSSRASRVYRSEGCDAIVAFGGGSVMDAAKVIGLAAANDKHPRELVGYFKGRHGPPPIYAVPTTAGTGSEVTVAAVISDPAHHRKLVIADTRIVPRMAALDPSLMTGLPPHITAATGMDALTHAVEAYIGGWGTAFTDRMALSAVGLIYQNLPRRLRRRPGPGRAREDGAGRRPTPGWPSRAPTSATCTPSRTSSAAATTRRTAWPTRSCCRRCCASRCAGHPGQAGGAGRARRASAAQSEPRPAGAEVPRLRRGDEPRAGHPAHLDALREKDIRRWPRPPAGRPTPTTRCRGDDAGRLRGAAARGAAAGRPAPQRRHASSGPRPRRPRARRLGGAAPVPAPAARAG